MTASTLRISWEQVWESEYNRTKYRRVYNYISCLATFQSTLTTAVLPLMEDEHWCTTVLCYVWWWKKEKNMEGNLEDIRSQKQRTLGDENSEHKSQVLSSLLLQQIIWLRERDDLVKWWGTHIIHLSARTNAIRNSLE